jgi:Leucine-rich repeat (LRR) protein
VLTDFDDTIRSEEIDLSNCNISDIDIDAFEEYELVRKVNLSGNQIEFVDRGTFAQNAKLTDLVLANNKLRSFSGDGQRRVWDRRLPLPVSRQRDQAL